MRPTTIALALLLAGCAAIRAYDEGRSTTTTAPPPSPKPALAVAAAPVKKPSPSPIKKRPPNVILRLHGSNTIGSELAPRLAEEFLRAQGATNVRRVDAGEHRLWVLADWAGRAVAVEIYGPGTKVGFQSLAAGRCDVAMASRAIEPSEAARLASLGDMTAPSSEHVLALDGVAVIVHPNNPIGRLTLDQVASIWAGFIVDWSQLGGAPGRIQRYSRDQKSGTFDTFNQLVMRGRAIEWRGMGAYEGSSALADAVASDERGIGFVGLPYARSARAVALQEGEAMPLYPTVFTVSTEDYPLARRLRLYTAAAPKNPLTARFVDFALTEAGQRLVDASGFVSLTVRAQAYRAPREAPDKYVRATQGGQRLSVNFRFKRGSAQLDNKARQDIDGIVKFLSGTESNRARKMMLFGFADKSGKEVVNRVLSRQRAEAVAAELKEHGVALDDVEGFGSALPLSSNDSDEGRERNRRVEVWMK